MENIVIKIICVVGGEDYVGTIKAVIIPPGVTMQTFKISLVNNSIVECDETFNVTIVSVTTCGVTIGSNNISEVKITDDDGKRRLIMIISVMSENII